jgi:COP9 signalosome complex subunit 6
MSDQYTRISCGGSPLAKDAPVVGLLFGQVDDQYDGGLQIRDADDIPTEISEASTVQVELHRAVFPQHSVVGWYRVSQSTQDDEPNANDLNITQQLKQHHAPNSMFCFCLLQVQNQQQAQSQKQEASSTKNTTTLNKELPINLYSLASVENTPILLGLSNWQLETAEPERIAVERVMKEQPQQLDGPQSSIYVSQAKSMENSLGSMEERIQVLIGFLEATKEGKIPPNHSLLRQVQALLYSLGPLSNMADSGRDDSETLAHLAAVAKTVSAVQSYTDKFRIIHENVARSIGKEARRAF